MAVGGQSLLSALEESRALLKKEGYEVPGVAVTGFQSSGKSSVLCSLTGISLPRGTGTVTRCPIVVHVRRTRDGEPEHARISRSVTYEPSERVESLDQVGDAVARHQPPGDVISETPVYVEVARVGYEPELQLIDLPGIVQLSRDGFDVHATTVGLVRKYISNPNMVILVVLPAQDDLETSEALCLARVADPEGKRTIGVLTKSDQFSPEDTVLKRHFVKKLQEHGGPTAELRLGYVAVRTRTATENGDGTTLSDVEWREQQLFAGDAIFAKLSAECWGVRTLKTKVSRIQEVMTQKFARDVVGELGGELQLLGAQLSELPPPMTPTNQLQIAQSKLEEMKRQLFRATRERNGMSIIGRFDERSWTMQKQAETAIFKPTEGARGYFQSTGFASLVREMWGKQGSGVHRCTEGMFSALLAQHCVTPLQRQVDVYLDEVRAIFVDLCDQVTATLAAYHGLAQHVSARLTDAVTAARREAQVMFERMFKSEIDCVRFDQQDIGTELTRFNSKVLAMDKGTRDDIADAISNAVGTVGLHYKAAMQLVVGGAGEVLSWPFVGASREGDFAGSRQLIHDLEDRATNLLDAYSRLVPRLAWTTFVDTLTRETAAVSDEVSAGLARQEPAFALLFREDEDLPRRRAELAERMELLKACRARISDALLQSIACVAAGARAN